MNHWPDFLEFCKTDHALGGPDPILKTLAQLVKDSTIEECVWAAGCYCATHAVPQAYATWLAFRPEDVVKDSRQLYSWLIEHWKALPCANTLKNQKVPEKRHRMLVDSARYALEARQYENYDLIWESSIGSIKFLGRYMGIKYIEILRLAAAPLLVEYDIRARGGWGPRRTLAFLYPDVLMLQDITSNDWESIVTAEHYASLVLKKLIEYGVDASFFDVQVFLCDFATRNYPGFLIDRELAHLHITQTQFPEITTPILKARSEVFPPEALGELNDWVGIRKEKLRIKPGSQGFQFQSSLSTAVEYYLGGEK